MHKTQKWDLYESLEFCGITKTSELIAVSIIPSVEKFDKEKGNWVSIPLENMPGRYERTCYQLQDKWLLANGRIFDLESHKSIPFFDKERSVPRLSRDARFILVVCNHNNNNEPDEYKGDENYTSIFHRATGALLATSERHDNFSLNLDEAVFSDKYTVESYTDNKTLICPTSVLWKYQAQFQEGTCTFDILMFIMFLDDLFQQGLILKESGVEITKTPLTRIMAIEIPKRPAHPWTEDFHTSPRTYTFLLKKEDNLYARLRTARLKILSASVQKISPYDPKTNSDGPEERIPKIKQLSSASLEFLKGLWLRLNKAQREELCTAYGTSL